MALRETVCARHQTYKITAMSYPNSRSFGLLLSVMALLCLCLFSTSALASKSKKSHAHSTPAKKCQLTGVVSGVKETATIPCPKLKPVPAKKCHVTGTLKGKKTTVNVPCPKSKKKNGQSQTGTGSGSSTNPNSNSGAGSSPGGDYSGTPLANGVCDDGTTPDLPDTDGFTDPRGALLCEDDTYPGGSPNPGYVCADGSTYPDDVEEGYIDVNNVLLCDDLTYPLLNGVSSNPVPGAENAGYCDDDSDPGTGGFDGSTPLCYDGSTVLPY